MSLHVFSGKGKIGAKGDSRCTPPEIWKPALYGAGIETFDLDPACNKFSTVPATRRWFGIKNDGLALDWFGNTWLNFPFSSANTWVDKVMAEIETPNVSSLHVLAPGDSSTKWWKTLAKNANVFATLAKRHHCPMPGQPKGSPGGNLNLFFFDFRDGPNNIRRWEKVHRHVGCITFRYKNEL